nr:Rrf2 family transcriptional regulator [uncultured Mediterraneibacter sp.]
MQLKLTTDYAVRTLMYLAGRRGVVPIAEIAEAMDIPEKYLNRIGLSLRDEGMIVTHRGKNGGYSLGKEPENIRLYDVVLLVEGTVAINRCLEKDDYCERSSARYCTVYKCYSVMQKKWENFLRGVTIAGLLLETSEEEIEKWIDRGADPPIQGKFCGPILDRKAVGVV